VGYIVWLRHSIDDIAQSASDQAISLSQINGAVPGMNRMTQQNAAMAEECKAAAHSLAHQVNGLTDTVQSFSLYTKANYFIEIIIRKL
jgi:methyl-accepting chemotaxis protein